MVPFNSRGPRFESSHWQTIYWIFTVNCVENKKIKKKEAGNGPLKHILNNILRQCFHWRLLNPARLARVDNLSATTTSLKNDGGNDDINDDNNEGINYDVNDVAKNDDVNNDVNDDDNFNDVAKKRTQHHHRRWRRGVVLMLPGSWSSLGLYQPKRQVIAFMKWQNTSSICLTIGQIRALISH